MPSEYTVRVVLEAEDHLTKALAYTRLQMKELGVIGAEEGDRLQKTFTALGAALERALGIGIYQAGEALRRFVYDSVEAFTRFEASSIKLASASRTAGQSVESLAQGFRVVASAAARELAVSGQEAMMALEALIKSGLSGAEAMEALRSSIMLARLEGVEFTEAFNSLVQVMAQFGLQGSEAARAADVLANASRLGIGLQPTSAGLANVGATARALGLSLEETASWLVILERRLGSAAEAGTQLNRLFLELYEIAGRLGVPVREGGEALRSTSEIMMDVIDAARMLGGDFELLQRRLAGVDARAVKALFTLTQMREEMGEMVNEISRSGAVWESYQNVLNTTEGRSASLRAETDRLQRVIGETAASIYYMVAPTFLKAFDAIFSGWRMLLGAITGSNFDRILGYLENQLRVFGRITEEQASQWIKAWTESGQITVSEALKIAEALGLYDANIQALIERAVEAGATIPESFSMMADAVSQSTLQASHDIQELSRAIEMAENAVRDFSTASKALQLSLDYYDLISTINQALGVNKALTQEQVESQQYLAATQNVLNYLTQTYSLQQQALQLYMMGASEAGGLLLNTLQSIQQALADGVVSQEEFVGLLGVMGVNAGDVAGSLHNILVRALETTRQAVEGNSESVASLIAQLERLNGMVVTYRIVEIRETSTQSDVGEMQEPGYSGRPYQRGAWNIPATTQAILHPSEMVLPRPVAEWFRRGGLVGRIVNINIQVNTLTPSTPNELADRISRELARRVRMA